MFENRIVFDLNAHVDEVSASVSVNESGIAVAFIDFFNCSEKTITDIKLCARGYNAFDEVIKVNGNDSFPVLIQDVHVDAYEYSSQFEIPLQDLNIRRLELVEDQVRFSDGLTCRYEGNNNHSFDVIAFDESDQDLVESYGEKYGSKFAYVPQIYKEGWICGCGNFNKMSSELCGYCRNKKTSVLEIRENEQVAKFIQNIENRKEEEQKLANRKRIIKRLICVAVLVILVGCALLVANKIEMDSRQTYSTVEKMRSALQGIWKLEDDSNLFLYYVINGDSIEHVINYQYLDEPIVHHYEPITWLPERGEFAYVNDDNKRIVQVVDKGGLTIRGGGKNKYRPSFENPYRVIQNEKKSKSESIRNTVKPTATPYTELANRVLKLTNLKVIHEGNYMYIKGSLTNNGSLTYDYVSVKGFYLDEDGTILDTDWTYVVGSEHLRPGETKSFSMATPYDKKMKKGRVELLDYKVVNK